MFTTTWFCQTTKSERAIFARLNKLMTILCRGMYGLKRNRLHAMTAVTLREPVQHVTVRHPLHNHLTSWQNGGVLHLRCISDFFVSFRCPFLFVCFYIIIHLMHCISQTEKKYMKYFTCSLNIVLEILVQLPCKVTMLLEKASLILVHITTKRVF